MSENRPDRLRVAIVGCGWVAGTQMETGFSLLPEKFEVAVACGFVSASHFSRAYKSRYGRSPKAERTSVARSGAVGRRPD